MVECGKFGCAQSANVSHTDLWSICVGKIEGFRGIFDLALCTFLGKKSAEVPKFTCGVFAKTSPSCPRMVGAADKT